MGIYSNLTPWKINMEPDNKPLEEENHLPNHHFQVLCNRNASNSYQWGIPTFGKENHQNLQNCLSRGYINSQEGIIVSFWDIPIFQGQFQAVPNPGFPEQLPHMILEVLDDQTPGRFSTYRLRCTVTGGFKRGKKNNKNWRKKHKKQTRYII